MTMPRWRWIAIPVVVSILALLLLAGYVSGVQAKGQHSSDDHRLPIVTLPGFDVNVFARGNSAYSHPDSVVADSQHIFVGYQNVTAKDGSDHKTSTVVEYTLEGEVIRTFSVPGHCDGLRIDPSTHLVWATSNEDGNPALVTINPKTGVITPYQFPPTPHGGGYDDLAFVNGMAFIAASNPNLNQQGVNVFPALDKIELSNGNVILTPVLFGNATALDTTTNSQVTLNEIDPDSLTVDPQGDVVLDNQAGSELVFLHNPGTPQQTVTRVPLGTQVDDTVWATATHGSLLVVDGSANVIYSLRANFTSGTVYTEAPNDSGVNSFVGAIDLSTGFITPVAIGFGSPTGLFFLPDTQH